MVMCNSLLYPASRGYIHITSPTDVDAPPDFDAGFLSHPADIAPLVWAFKKTREVSHRLPAFKELVVGPSLPLVSDDISPNQDLPGQMKEFVPAYTPEDDTILEKYIRDRAASTYHPR
jgi:alcohol oxidase